MGMEELGKNRRSLQTIDPVTAIGIGAALHALHAIAEGKGRLQQNGDTFNGILNEAGSENKIMVSRESFEIDGKEVVREPHLKSSERLEDVSSRLFDLASLVANGINRHCPKFVKLSEEIKNYLHDQNRVEVRFININDETGGLSQETFPPQLWYMVPYWGEIWAYLLRDHREP
jgi:hypothetical protein